VERLLGRGGWGENGEGGGSSLSLVLVQGKKIGNNSRGDSCLLLRTCLKFQVSASNTSTQTNLQRKNKTAEDILVLNEQTAHNAAAATHALLIMSQTTA
jgi:hypothetical protein